MARKIYDIKPPKAAITTKTAKTVNVDEKVKISKISERSEGLKNDSSERIFS